jgi:hypothetical protein
MPGVTDVSALVSEVRRVSQAEIWVLVSPLNVRAPAVASSAFGRRWDQAEINAAYLAAFDAWSEQPSVSWLPPIPLEGRYVRTDAFTHLAECRVEL